MAKLKQEAFTDRQLPHKYTNKRRSQTADSDESTLSLSLSLSLSLCTIRTINYITTRLIPYLDYVSTQLCCKFCYHTYLTSGEFARKPCFPTGFQL